MRTSSTDPVAPRALRSIHPIAMLACLVAIVSSCGGGGDSGAGPVDNPPPTLTFTATPATVPGGSGATLDWNSTSADSCMASGSWSGSKATAGSFPTGNLAATATYTLSCSGPNGNISRSATVTVTAPVPAPTVNLAASPMTLSSGQITHLTWSSGNATSCTASGGWSGPRGASGNEDSAALTSSTAFLLACTGPGGTGSNSVTVTVSGSPPPAPVVSLTAFPQAVTSGQTTHLTWSSSNATGCAASGGWSGSRSTSGSEDSGVLTATTTFTLSCTGSGGTSPDASATVTVGSARFPLHVEAGKRYLIDASDKPFLIQGEAAWSLIVQLTDAQVDQYLDDRMARGFNTLLVNLLEHKFANNPPKNAYGDGPFTSANDFSTPNEAYFAHAASVIQKAKARGMLVLLTPAYMGFNGGDEGWYAAMSSNGATRLQAYGVYLAHRFAAYDNILWLHGGDYTPPNLNLANAIANGILSVSGTWLHTFHGSPESSARTASGNASWLNVNDVYSYDANLISRIRAEYDASTRPLFLLESNYESAQPGTTTQLLRAHAYQALLAGASGQIFGNNPIWHFDAPNPLAPYSGTWVTALNSNGTKSLQHLQELWLSKPWSRLEYYAAVGSSGAAALASDKSFAIAYLTGPLTVDLSLLAPGGASVTARWYNPFTGAYTPIGTAASSGSQVFTPPGSNGDGTDWILLLEAHD